MKAGAFVAGSSLGLALALTGCSGTSPSVEPAASSAADPESLAQAEAQRLLDNVSPPRFSFAPCSASQMENVRTYEITNSGVAPSGTPCGGAAPQPACVTRITTSDPGRLLQYVAPTTDWIRLQRRFPVTLTLVDPPSDLKLYMGADARTLVLY